MWHASDHPTQNLMGEFSDYTVQPLKPHTLSYLEQPCDDLVGLHSRFGMR